MLECRMLIIVGTCPLQQAKGAALQKWTMLVEFDVQNVVCQWP